MATYGKDIAGRTCVYRAYIGWRLAYVGVTRNTRGRFSKHSSLKPWWRDVDYIDVEWFATRAEAFAAEKRAIAEEAPMHNIARPKVA